MTAGPHSPISVPDFIGVGAPKCGTTTLHNLLMRHPDIFLPAAKELHFFDNPANFARGSGWYFAQFAGRSAGQIAGEFTPAYMSYPETAARIREVCGTSVRIIFTIRDPVARAFSEFQDNLRRGLVRETDFERALALEDSATGSRFDRRHFSFITRSRYSEQIARFLQIFPRENLHFVRFEDDLVADIGRCVADLLRFLGVRVLPLRITEAANAATVPYSVTVNRLLNRRNPLRSLISSLLPGRQLRQSVRSMLIRLNTSGVPPPKLDAALHRQLMRRYFPGEQVALERLTGLSFAAWQPADEVPAAHAV